MPPWEEGWTEPVETEKTENQPELSQNASPRNQQLLVEHKNHENLKTPREHSEQKLQNPEEDEKEEEEEEQAVSLCDRLMLVSSLFSIEMCMSFQQLYEILFLQFLGVPVALVSVNGILAGTAGMLILPLIGSWADRGSNSKKRKMIAMSVGLVVFVSGLVLLVIASAVKIKRLDNVIEILHGHRANVSLVTLNHGSNSYSDLNTFNTRLNDSYSVLFTDLDTLNETVIPGLDHWEGGLTDTGSGEEDNTPVGIIIISILGFMGLDMGFDLTIALSRASILDVVPKFQHKQVLVLATIVQSVAGFVCAAIGCLDLPAILGSMFDTDGSAATLIFFCCVLLTTSFLSFSLMGFANYRLDKRKERESITSTFEENSSEYTKTNEEESMIQAAFGHLEERGSLCINSPATRLKYLHDNQVFASSSMGAGNANAYKRPLLADSLKTNYLTINQDFQPVKIGELDADYSVKTRKDNGLDPSMVLNTGEEASSIPTENRTVTRLSISGASLGEEQQTAEDEEVAAVLEAISQPSAGAMTPLEALNVANVVETELITTEEEDIQKPVSSDWDQRYRKMKLKFLILWVSSFFSVGSSLTFSLYSFNALNIGIMHGDPTALPGSEGRRKYEHGLKLGSFGNMVFYSAFLLISLTNTRVIRVLGEKTQFVMNHVILIIGLVAVMTSQRVDVFMVYMGCCGLFRPCMLTLPYVMAHQFAQEGMPAEHEESGQKKSHTGRVMTLIGFLVPSHYCLLSIIMGPLMEATGNPWVPLFYCLGTCTVSLGVFSLLFFV